MAGGASPRADALSVICISMHTSCFLVSPRGSWSASEFSFRTLRPTRNHLASVILSKPWFNHFWPHSRYFLCSKEYYRGLDLTWSVASSLQRKLVVESSKRNLLVPKKTCSVSATVDDLEDTALAHAYLVRPRSKWHWRLGRWLGFMTSCSSGGGGRRRSTFHCFVYIQHYDCELWSAIDHIANERVIHSRYSSGLRDFQRLCPVAKASASHPVGQTPSPTHSALDLKLKVGDYHAVQRGPNCPQCMIIRRETY